VIMKKKYLLTVLGMLSCIACHRPQEEGSSVSIRIPSVSQFAKSSKQEAIAFSTIPYSRLCFAVNVKGPGIPISNPGTCNVDRGIFEGKEGYTVPPGGEIVIEVPGGDNREFEVYGFLRDAATDPCPVISSDWGWSMQKIYLLATKSAVQIVPPSSTVEIQFVLPDETHNLAVHKGWPQSCGGVPTITKGLYGKILVGSKDLSGGSFKMRAHISDKQLEPVLTGTNGVKFRGGVR